jgi:hypothetical protein
VEHVSDLRILIEDPRRFSFELTADFWIVGTVPTNPNVPKAKVMVSSKYLPKSTKIAMDSAPKSYIIGNSTKPGPEWKRRPIRALGVVWKF